MTKQEKEICLMAKATPISCGNTADNRRVHYGTFNSPTGMFVSREEALLALESICREIKRLCERNSCNCLLYGVISETEKNTTYRTRYGTKYYTDNILSPHIHITYLIQKHSAMEKIIKKYLKDRFGKRFFFQPIRDSEYLQNRVHYCVSQCMNYRVVNTCSEDFAKRYAGKFVALIEKENKAWGNGKLVFKDYQDMVLGSDDSVFDFSFLHKKAHSKTNEVLTEDIENQAFSICTENIENNKFICQNTEQQELLGVFSPYQQPFSTTPNQCCEI